MKINFIKEKYVKHVKSINDEEFSSISTNQSAYCVALFAQNFRKLKKYFAEDHNKFIEIYNDCLLKGSLLRKQYGINSFGENIDSNIIDKHINLETCAYLHMKLNNDMKVDMDENIKKEYYTREGMEVNHIKFINGEVYIMVSRHIESFILFPITSHMFLLLDPTKNVTGLIDKTMMKQLVYSDRKEYTHIIFMVGQ